jgi:hypothetical protein
VSIPEAKPLKRLVCGDPRATAAEDAACVIACIERRVGWPEAPCSLVAPIETGDWAKVLVRCGHVDVEVMTEAGGVEVAREMARQLRARGHQAPMIIAREKYRCRASTDSIVPASNPLSTLV